MIDTSSVEQGESVVHFGAIRVRVNGIGMLIPTFQSLDNQSSQTLAPLVMNPLTGIEPVRLANFISQRAFLKLETLNKDEIFKINRVVIFVKPIWSQYYDT